ncbi:glutamate-5-semialdehyde dehydrogenase [Acidaminobacter sp.]|uniref:glutamate-5-semialdehyde dehydrogenase n=1 Tax=Acidaminobacter sp. TaxID=1872102 RepID=UPI00137E459C|nr:glutamate-5-semialdehyde dehydrogenase [Acidaminobacter sp.]MDK9711361.1 glutamate-5-semialdehyde dehydrogenase [Acidaminobacter sp.]MZQ96586.1 glutamate-5-semialdehyde dehydrogenase [Acidaminobacter sp.]
MSIQERAHASKKASIRLAALDGETKNNALEAIAIKLEARKTEIIAANREDCARVAAESPDTPLLKRLRFEDEKLAEVTEGIRSLMKLPEPVGQTKLATQLDNGLDLYRISCPIGVIGVIFESRPDALVQISSLCLKSGNAVLLKGGSEAANTNRILAQIISEASVEAGLPEGWIQLIETRADVSEMLKLSDDIDLLIPRGSNDFVKYIMDNSSIPVLGHADGVCHIYLHSDADEAKMLPILVDAKTQYVAACNTMETLLVHESVAARLLPEIQAAMEAKNVALVGCDQTRKIISVGEATEKDWRTEYVDYKLSIKVVSSLEDAIEHINTYGSGHTDAILTEDEAAAKTFMTLVDSANVFWNCSTRFSDGFRYGFGAEVGISTSKIHARGPVGLDGLMIYKYKLIGHGQTVGEFASGKLTYTHEALNKDCPL